MRTTLKLLSGLIILASVAQADPPYISYVYPAGGQAGQSVEILVGGRNLRAPEAVYVTDKAASPSVVEYIPPARRPIADEDRKALRDRFNRIYKAFKDNDQKPLTDEQIEKLQAELPKYPKNSPLNHPLLRDIESLNPTELKEISSLFSSKKVDPQFAEMTSIKVTIRANTKPGMYEIRLLTSNGLSNPLNFQINKLPEYKEREPNNEECYLDAVNVPFIFNGKIMPGDIDMFSFNAEKGQKLVIEANARNLKPYLADAVPGWFQAVLSVCDNQGKELAFCDDYMFNPDPIIFFDVPQTDTYIIKINDSIYRGREDFIYRVSISDKPFVTSIFPLGTSAGTKTTASVEGWNLPTDTVELDGMGSNRGSLRSEMVKSDNLFSNKFVYAVDALPDCLESSDNDSIKTAQKVELPIIINGKIESKGDNDYFCFEGTKGSQIVLEVNARRLNSPLDSAVQLYDQHGKNIATNDDYDNKAVGLQTHHADSYLKTELPEDGKYYVRIFDIRNDGSEKFAYRLRISEPMPTYELRLSPSSLALKPGQTGALKVDVIRKDGFDDDIMLGLRSSPPANYKLSGGKIPAGKDSIYITVTAPPKLKDTSELTIESRARTSEGVISKTAIAAENMMQAFAYYQLVPSQDLLATQENTRLTIAAFEAKQTDIKLNPGQTTKLTFTNQLRGDLSNREISAKLLTETEYLTLQNTETTPNSLILTVNASDACPVGYKDNIVFGLSMQTEFKRKDGSMQKQTVSLNELPAVTVEITDKNEQTKITKH